MHPYLPLVVACSAAIALTFALRFFAPRLRKIFHHGLAVAQDQEKDGKNEAVDPYTAIEPIPDFDWRSEKPLKIRPFKPKYHLTMSIENTSMQDLVAVDDTYADRIQLRRQLIRDHPAATIGLNSVAEAAVYEFYDWMMWTYLPLRYPSMYSIGLKGAGEKSHFCLRNVATNQNIPLCPSSAEAALRTLGGHVDTDFLFLLPREEDDKYHLEAFVTCFPSGFSTREKLGLPLAAIHTPVPGYANKLEKSMDRFFANMPEGKIVKRANWSVTTDDLLFKESGTHFHEAEGPESAEPGDASSDNSKTLDVSSPNLDEDIARQRESVVVENCRLRCERQTLHRLPKSKALVFAFKTYQYTMAEVKQEGSGEDLALAINGLGMGNVPGMKYYKRGIVWGEKVKEYMRS